MEIHTGVNEGGQWRHICFNQNCIFHLEFRLRLIVKRFESDVNSVVNDCPVGRRINHVFNVYV